MFNDGVRGVAEGGVRGVAYGERVRCGEGCGGGTLCGRVKRGRSADWVIDI